MRTWARRGLLILLGALVVMTGWSTYRATQVRDDLTQAREQANTVQQQLLGGDVEVATSALPALQRRVDRAAQRTSGPAWRVTQLIPVVGGNFKAVRRVALAAQVLGDEALPEAQAALAVARRERVMRDGRVDFAVLDRLKARIDRAAQAASRADGLVQTRQRLLIGPVARGVGDAREKVGDLDAGLGSAQRSLAIAPEMLGAQGPRRYFVAVQNNAESRATGGLIGAFALVRADRGVISLERTGTNDELEIADEPVPSDPKAAKLWKSLDSTRAWYAANFTPHFPDVAQNISGLWAAQTGQRVDGVLALDPIVMRELMRATGPVRLTDGTLIGAESVAEFVWRDEYVKYPDIASRKGLLSGLAGTLFRRVVEVREPLPLVQAFARVGQSGHFFAWSRHPAEQQELAKGRVGGSLPLRDVPYLSVLTQNFVGNKLDYYIRRRVVVKQVEPGRLQVDVTLRNTAPPGLPAYVTIRSDRPIPPLPYAQAGVGFSVYGAPSSEVLGVWVDGKRTSISFDRDHGHRMGTFALELPRGEEVTVRVLMTQPKGALVYRDQPLVTPDDVFLHVRRIHVESARPVGTRWSPPNMHMQP